MAAQIKVSDLLAYGEEAVGKPYVRGAAGPSSFDCSGLVKWMYAKFGVDLPHHAADQAKMGTAVDVNNIQAGDLVFSDWGDGPNSHVGIATDTGHILVAPHTGTDVQVQTLGPGYKQHITAVRRVGNLTGAAGTVPAPSGSSGTAGGNTDGVTISLADFGTGASAAAGQVQDWWKDLWTGAGGIIKGDVATATQPLTLVAAPLMGIADFFENVMLLFKPSNFLRLVSGISGVALILIGIWLLSSELRD